MSNKNAKFEEYIIITNHTFLQVHGIINIVGVDPIQNNTLPDKY